MLRKFCSVIALISFLMINFLSSKGKLEAYPCGIDVKESKKMLNEFPEFRNIDFVSVRARLHSALSKKTSPSRAKVDGRK